MTHYLYMEIAGIQRFVFAAPKLKIIRGGSALLDTFNRVEMWDAARAQGGKVVFAGGGHCLVNNLTREVAEKIGTHLSRKLRKMTDGQASLVFGVAPEGEWCTVQAAYRADLERRALESPPMPPPLPPFVALCSSCGVSPARELENVGERHLKPLCHACLVRRKKGQEITRMTRMTTWDRLHRHLEVFGAPGDRDAFCRLLPEREFEELVEQGSGSKYLAYLYCDGNGMGKWLKGAGSATGYGKASQMVDDALHKAVASAISRCCSPEGSKGKYSAEVLLLGGDDLIVAMPADRAADFTQEVLEVFFEKTDQKIRLSAGLVFAPHNPPITILQQVATSLLRSAKRYAYLDEMRQRLGRRDMLCEKASGPLRQPANGYVDFQELTSAEVDIERHDAVTCRPYRLDDFKVLVERTRELRDVNVPRGRLHALAEALSGSEREARTITQLVVGRSNFVKGERDALRDLLRPFHPVDGGCAQVYPKYPNCGDLPFDLYCREDPEKHLWSAIPDALELIDHLSGGRP